MQTTIEIRTKDASKISLGIYQPEENIGKVMIIAPTGGETKELYDPLACFFRQQGFTVITFDYRGMGSSGPEQLKGYKASMQQWAVQDIDAVILYAKKQYPNQEIVYLGHCIGGEIVGLAQASQYINRLVLVNSALSCKKLWPLKYRFRIATMKTVVKLLNNWFGYFPGKKIGYEADIPGGVIYEWSNWCSNANGLFDKFPDNNYRKLQVPLLAISFSDNWNTPPKAVKELLNRFANSVVTWHHIRPGEIGAKKIGHSGFFDPQKGTTLWIKMMQWLNEGERAERPGTAINY
ncbi:MAG TPA: alpha/beta fold hydrolase [Chitinophagaceae bacterium]